MAAVNLCRRSLALVIWIIACTIAAESSGPSINLQNRIFTFGTIQLDPLYSQYGDGFIRNLSDRVAKHANIQHRIVSYSGDIYGGWDNLVHTVANGEIDVGATLLTKTPCREKLVSFTAPFLTSTMSALYHGNRGVLRAPEELLSSGFELGTLNHSAITDVLADSPDTTTQKILNEVMSKNGVLVHTVAEGVARARHSSFAFILDTVIAHYIASQKPCELKTLELSTERFKYAFTVRKGSPLLEPLTAAILDMTESGILAELVKRLIYDKKECWDTR